MFKLSIVLAIAVVAVSAIPLKPNDMPKRIEQAEKDSNQDLAEFVQAWKSNDKQSVTSMTNFIIKIANSGYEHSIKLNKNFAKMAPILQKLAHSRVPFAMKAVAKLIDGNRDNKSYYDLETVIQWINKRVAAGVQDANLTKAVVAAKESQDALQAMADAFVSTIKTLKTDTSDMAALMDGAIAVMNENSAPFIERFADSLRALNDFRASVAFE